MSEEKLRSLLDALGTAKTRHSGRNLKAHLIGTYRMLRAAGCDEQVCLAGGLHSIYGTDVFRMRTLTTSARPDVAKMFGERAERLAYSFGAMHPRTKLIENGQIVDAHDLRLIEAANILEQGGSLDRCPNIALAWLDQIAHGQKKDLPKEA